MKHRMPTVFLLVVALATVASGAELEDGFKNPPEETEPWCYRNRLTIP